MIAQAIDEAVEQTKATLLQQSKTAASTSNEVTPPATSTAEPKPTIHQSNMNAAAVDSLLRQLVRSNYESVEKFFEAAKGQGGVIGRTDWKTATKLLGLNVGNTARKELRKRIAGSSKTITLEQLSSFVGGAGKSGSVSRQIPESASDLCVIPLEVPPLPDKFHPRDGPLKALIASLVEQQTATVSLTAPKARNSIASQGMGGKI